MRLQVGNGANVAEMSVAREVIGSGDTASWRLRGSENVAAEHAALVVDADDTLWIEDLASGLPTLVDGERLTGRRRLLGTERVVIGEGTLTVTGLLPDGRVPEGSLWELPRAGAEEAKLEEERNTAIDDRLTNDAAQDLAFAWSDRAVRVHVAGALEEADLLDLATALRRLPRVRDRASSMALDGAVRALIDPVQEALQQRKDAGRARESLEPMKRALHAARLAHDAARAALAPYTGSPGFAVMIAYDEDSIPPPDNRATRTQHARPRAGVVAGRLTDTARMLDAEGGLAEVRVQLKEVLDIALQRKRKRRAR